MSNNQDYMYEEDELAIDELIQPIIDELKFEMDMTGILNPIRMDQMKRSYAILRRMTEGSGVRVSYELNTPFRTIGSISLEGKLMQFENNEMFMQALKDASNTEVYPLTNGSVKMTLTFHGLVKLIK